MSLSCSLFVLYSPRNDPDPEMIPFQELIGDHFGVDVKRNGDHFGVDLGIIGGCTVPKVGTTDVVLTVVRVGL